MGVWGVAVGRPPHNGVDGAGRAGLFLANRGAFFPGWGPWRGGAGGVAVGRAPHNRGRWCGAGFLGGAHGVAAWRYEGRRPRLRGTSSLDPSKLTRVLQGNNWANLRQARCVGDSRCGGRETAPQRGANLLRELLTQGLAPRLSSRCFHLAGNGGAKAAGQYFTNGIKPQRGCRNRPRFWPRFHFCIEPQPNSLVMAKPCKSTIESPSTAIHRNRTFSNNLPGGRQTTFPVRSNRPPGLKNESRQ